jgi:hypothetical protein
VASYGLLRYCLRAPVNRSDGAARRGLRGPVRTKWHQLWIAVLGRRPRLLRGKLGSHLDSRGIVLRATRIQVEGIKGTVSLRCGQSARSSKSRSHSNL